MMRGTGAEGGGHVGSFTHDLDVGLGREAGAQSQSDQGLLGEDEDADRSSLRDWCVVGARRTG
jgi:hypothetical protein